MGGLFLKIKSLFSALFGFLGKLSKKEWLIFSGLGFAFIFLIFAAVFLISNKVRQRNLPVPPATEKIVIPPDELFLPDEPDFIPGVLLERERRSSWSAQDAESFWQDPLRNGEEPWRDQVEAIIDELMERVP